MKLMRKLWMWILILIVLSPLGVLLPEYFKSRGAWGEWSTQALTNLVGYTPEGLKKSSGFWKAPMADYTLNGLSEQGTAGLSLTYILSAVIGITVVVAMVILIGKVLVSGDRKK